MGSSCSCLLFSLKPLLASGAPGSGQGCELLEPAAKATLRRRLWASWPWGGPGCQAARMEAGPQVVLCWPPRPQGLGSVLSSSLG